MILLKINSEYYLLSFFIYMAIEIIDHFIYWASNIIMKKF